MFYPQGDHSRKYLIKENAQRETECQNVVCTLIFHIARILFFIKYQGCS